MKRQYGLIISFISLFQILNAQPDSVAIDWIQHYNSASIPSSDAVTDLKVDPAGNIYVTGHSEGSGSSEDYFTIKYYPDGLVAWEVRYDGPAHGSDRAYSLTLDTEENVYVTGRSMGTDSTNDYATIKYQSDGTEEWVTRYNGPGYGFDEASALVVDAVGNVYVTGTSEGAGTGSDYFTIKYDPDGVELWTARYNDPDNNWDRAWDLAVDALGNVFVTGESRTNETGRDYLTVKYTSDGSEAWVVRKDGLGEDAARAIVTDSVGNVYITGSIASGTSPGDYGTIKYDTDGNELWFTRYTYDGYDHDGRAIAIDNAGNVYVTGWSDGSSSLADYATIKYNPDGSEEWAARYNGPGNLRDQAHVVAVDDSGNVYVTGESEVTWDVFDYCTIKYNPDGSEAWVAIYTTPGIGTGSGLDLAIDAEKNVYVTGVSEGWGTEGDYVTIKYTPNGTEAWLARYSGPANGMDKGTALALDSDGNIYVTGWSVGSGSLSDYTTIKYNSEGSVVWLERFDHWNDFAEDIFVDAVGNVYVTGTTAGSNGYSNYTTIKFVQPSGPVSIDNALFPAFPAVPMLAQNYPNPFNPVSTIRYDLPQASDVSLIVYDIVGREVARLVDSYMEPGNHSVQWDGRDANGQQLPSGIYIARLVTPGYTKSIKMVLLR